MFTLTVWLVQHSVLDEIRKSAPAGMANVFFIDITEENRDAIAKVVQSHRGIERPLEIIGTVSCRLEAVDGVPADQLQLAGGRARRYRMARNISAEASKPEGTQIIEGSWWEPDTGQPQISVTRSAARSLNLRPGSTIIWNANGQRIQTRVAAIHDTEEQRLRGMMEFHVSPVTFEGLPKVYYAATRIRSDAIGSLQREVFHRFPTVTVINVAEVLDRIQQVVDQISVIVRFLGAFAVFAGAVILASSVAGTRFRRIREIAVFKTLGATRGRIIAMFSAEYFLLGAAAGLLGSLLANGFTSVLLWRLFDDVPFRFDALSIVVSVVATALLASVAGWLASFRILGQKPLEVLRGE
jgi:putative ABC transport system permease protein